jgi:hypothetical protein
MSQLRSVSFKGSLHNFLHYVCLMLFCRVCRVNFWDGRRYELREISDIQLMEVIPGLRWLQIQFRIFSYSTQAGCSVEIPMQLLA